MEKRIKDILDQGNKLFEDRRQVLTLWQEIALQFYPEMADFTLTRTAGQDLASHLTTSYPVLARRTLGDMLSALLRPVNLDTASPGIWFSLRSTGREDKDARAWLEWSTGTMRRAMYDREARFVRATKEGDHAFASFGQAVISVELNKMLDTLLFRSWHLRDVAWSEDATGEISAIYRKWKPTAQQLVDTFGNKTSATVRERLKDNPFQEIECCHAVLSRDMYEKRDQGGKKYRTPWISIWIDKTNEHVMEEVGSLSRIYVIPRWATVPGSQYAVSPAVVAALPDARLIQAMTLTMLEASEKLADPPLIATHNVLRSDIDTRPGGTTWVDDAFDGKLSPLRPIYDPRSGDGLRTSFEMNSDIRQQISRAFYLDSINLPQVGEGGMSAFEVGQRISEWIRRAMPIFEPMEFEYNGALCDEVFGLLMRNGGFGAYGDIPQSLRGKDIQFKFESPLHESNERRKGQKYLEAQAILLQGTQVDPSVRSILKAPLAIRDALEGIGVPAVWTRDENEVAEMEKARQAQAAMASTLQGIDVAAGAADKLGSAVKNFAGARATA